MKSWRLHAFVMTCMGAFSPGGYVRNSISSHSNLFTLHQHALIGGMSLETSWSGAVWKPTVNVNHPNDSRVSCRLPSRDILHALCEPTQGYILRPIGLLVHRTLKDDAINAYQSGPPDFICLLFPKPAALISQPRKLVTQIYRSDCRELDQTCPKTGFGDFQATSVE